MGCERAGGGGLRWLWVDEREREREREDDWFGFDFLGKLCVKQEIERYHI